MKQKIVSLKDCTLVCHEDARGAFSYSQGYESQFDLSNIPAETILMLQEMEPLDVIAVTPSHYKFFYGWFWLPAIYRCSTSSVKVAVHKATDRTDIELLSWLYVQSLFLQSQHSKSILANFASLLKHMPMGLKARLLNVRPKASANTLTMNISGESRATLRYQQSRSAHGESTEFESIIGALSRALQP